MVSVKFRFFLTVVAVLQCGVDETGSLERSSWLSMFTVVISLPAASSTPRVLDLGRLCAATLTGMTYPVLMDD